MLQENKVAFDYNNYLTIEALEDDCYVIFTNDIEYGIDGMGWKRLPSNAKSPTIKSGQTISFRGELKPTDDIGIGRFTISKKCNLKGNIMSMLFGDNAANNYSLRGKNYAFYNLFYNCSTIINTNNLSLPATVLERKCYSYMFYDCTSLTTAPALPATILADSCYNNMFQNCTSLTTAPALPATTLATSCYQSMFQNCTSLTTAPALPATILATFCYRGMFQGCTSLTTAPELPATTLADDCYVYMFSNCTNLTTASELPATTLAFYCYFNMFNGCTKLRYIKMLATNISAYNCLYNWVRGVSSTGTFIKNAAMTSLPTGSSGIPSGWTVQNA